MHRAMARSPASASAASALVGALGLERQLGQDLKWSEPTLRSVGPAAAGLIRRVFCSPVDLAATGGTII
jgi:hypothetical protein